MNTEREAADDANDDTGCRSCGSTAAPQWATSDGKVHLCPPCATVHGIGCP